MAAVWCQCSFDILIDYAFISLRHYAIRRLTPALFHFHCFRHLISLLDISDFAEHCIARRIQTPYAAWLRHAIFRLFSPSLLRCRQAMPIERCHAAAISPLPPRFTPLMLLSITFHYYFHFQDMPLHITLFLRHFFILFSLSIILPAFRLLHFHCAWLAFTMNFLHYILHFIYTLLFIFPFAVSSLSIEASAISLFLFNIALFS